MSHVADRILSAIQSRLASVAGIMGVHYEPFFTLDANHLPAIVIDDIEDQVDEAVGQFPVDETRKLSFVVKVCQMGGSAAFSSGLATLHEAVSIALFGSRDAITLGGLLTRGLREVSATRFTDAESLQKPVGGWAIQVTCTYNLRSDVPGLTEKESS